jgi:CheY-like chemotaxis protein
LGLALAKGIMDLHHGTLEAHSDGPGTGAEFVVRLPLTSPPGDVPDEQPHEDARSEILIVDDNEDAAQMLRELLTISGHVVMSAASGAEALDLLHRHGAAVILCDIGLPGMSGYEFARAIRSAPDLKDIPLIAVTGYGQPEDRKRSADVGFDHHLVKPIDLQDLARVIDRFSHGRVGA